MYVQQWCFCAITTFELLTFKEKGGHVDPDQELLCSNLSQSICSWPPSHKLVASSIGKDLGSKLGKKKAISLLKMQTSEKDKIQQHKKTSWQSHSWPFPLSPTHDSNCECLLTQTGLVGLKVERTCWTDCRDVSFKTLTNICLKLGKCLSDDPFTWPGTL